MANFFFRSARCASRQARGDLVEPAVDRLLVDRQLGHALLVEQRRHRLVLDRALHGVGMHDGAELVGRLFVLQQRRAGEGDVGGIAAAPCCMRSWVSPPWLRWPSSTSTIRSARVVAAFRQLGGRVELVHQREDDAFGAAADALGQVAAREVALALLALLLRRDGRAEGAAA